MAGLERSSPAALEQMIRDDISGRRAPAWLQRIIARRFGSTPYGEPRYRLVWGPSRLERSGGEWTDWRNGQMLRRVPELRRVRKYPGVDCWLIERWMPPESYGPPWAWYRPAADGGTILPSGIGALGDYPTFGDYEDIGARMFWYPTEHHVVTAITASERVTEELPMSPAARAVRRTWLAEREQERRDAEYDAAAADLFDDSAPAFHGAAMIGYGGSHRPALVEMAERAGIREHPL